jgi:hypothetical protein
MATFAGSSQTASSSAVCRRGEELLSYPEVNWWWRGVVWRGVWS